MNQELIIKALESIGQGADRIVINGDTEKTIVSKSKKTGTIKISVKALKTQG